MESATQHMAELEQSAKCMADPKCRILRAATHLFARKGFSGVGVREIARAAQVNISMISYYFSGKSGILSSIIEEYFTRLGEIICRVKALQLDPSENLRQIVGMLVDMFRYNTDLCKVAIMELPIDQPGVADFKVELLREYSKVMKDLLPPPPFKPSTNQSSIIGPAFISMLLSHFLLKDIVVRYNNIELNDEYYEEYAETIYLLFSRGINGLIEFNALRGNAPGDCACNLQA